MSTSFIYGLNIDRKTAAFAAMLAIIVVGAIVYANSLCGKFVWDDFMFIKDNDHIKDWRFLPKFFTASTGEGAGLPNAYYRPMELLSYALDYSFWKFDVRGYHLTNILIHLSMSACVFWLILLVSGELLLASIVGMLYVVCPMHVEAVAYISGRPEMIAAVFLLVCLINYILFFKRRKVLFYCLSLTACVLAFLSRENAIIMPLLLLLWHFLSKTRVRLSAFLPFVGITIGYIVLRLSIFSFTPHYTEWLSSAASRIPGFFVVVFRYLRFLVLPLGLHASYGPGDMAFSWLEPAAIAGVIIVTVLIACAWRFRNTHRFVSFSILWFFTCLLLYTTIYPRLPFYMNDHHMYLSSIGFFLLLAYGLRALFRRHSQRVGAFAILFLLVAFYSLTTIQQNKYWSEPIAFYEKTLAVSPCKAKIYMNLGHAYCDIGKLDEALTSYKKVAALEPADAYTLYNIGVVYLQKKEYDNAIDSFKQSLKQKPDFGRVHNNLGAIYVELGNYQEAIASFQKAIDCNPYFAQPWNNMGSTYARAGQMQQAIVFFKKALQIQPSYEEARRNLETAYEYLNQKGE